MPGEGEREKGRERGEIQKPETRGMVSDLACQATLLQQALKQCTHAREHALFRAKEVKRRLPCKEQRSGWEEREVVCPLYSTTTRSATE
eukprot:2581943-Rhodomonas_salina.3